MNGSEERFPGLHVVREVAQLLASKVDCGLHESVIREAVVDAPGHSRYDLLLKSLNTLAAVQQAIATTRLAEATERQADIAHLTAEADILNSPLYDRLYDKLNAI